MKKGILIGLLAVLLIAVLITPGAAEEPRTLTLMIYMCGSNLESGSAAASADFQEILNAGFDENITVLIMTGGSRQWAQGFSADQTVISEVRLNKRGKIARKTVWTEDTRNMGDASTLTALLQFGIEQYPATDYALILWDHGGGPLEGVCWDELFSMDNLQLDELTASLEEASLPQKLKWIGFDACLMSTLEVAQAVSPYAEYMIASQETEPALGWNYRFLADISRDATGAETGKRIVDAFFEGREDADETLTLACMDLSQIPAIAEEMDTLFRSAASLDEDSFVRMSSLRKDTANFGKSVLPSGEDGYDLVDLYDLAERINGSVGDCQPLLDTLSSAIVYARANMTGAHGLSVYYPYTNKIKYAGKWRENYRDVRASRQYLRYMEDFGAMLLGEETVDWSGMHGEEVAADERGNHLAMQLTPEQAGQYVSGQMMILMPGHFNSTQQQNYALIGSFPAQINENGLVTASFTGKTLYIQKENGDYIGPVNYHIKEDSEYNYVMTLYTQAGDSLIDALYVSYSVERESNVDGTVSSRIRVMDEAIGAYSSRIALHEELYSMLYIPNTFRAYPGLAPREAQPAYTNWEIGQNEISGTSFALPNQWRFVYLDKLLSSGQLYAVFQVTDVRQNSYTSDLIPLTNLNLEDIPMSPDRVEADTFALTATLHRSISDLESGLRLRCTITNQTDLERSYRIHDCILNGHRQIYTLKSQDIAPGASEDYDILLNALDLTGLENAESLSFTVTASPREYNPSIPTTHTTCSFSLSDGSLAGIAPAVHSIGSGEADGVKITVLSVEYSPVWNGDLNVMSLIENNSDQTVNFKGAALINDRLELNVESFDDLPSGSSRLQRIGLRNIQSVLSTTEVMVNPDDILEEIIVEDELVQRSGQNPIRTITLLPGYGNSSREAGEPLQIQLQEPGQLGHPQLSSLLFSFRSLSPDHITAVPLTDCDRYQVDVTSVLIGHDAIVVSLRVENKTDAPLTVLLPGEASLNDVAISSNYLSDNFYLLAPRAEGFCMLVLGKGQEMPAPEDMRRIQLRFSCEEQENEPVSTILLPESLSAGDYIPGDRLSAVVAEPPVFSEPDLREIQVEPETPTTLYENEIQLPPSLSDCIVTLTAPLTAEETQDIKSATFCIARKTESGTMQMLHYQGMKKEQTGVFTSVYHGLLACLQIDPGIFWCESNSNFKDGHFTGTLWGNAYITYDDINTDQTVINKFMYDLDVQSGTAVITDVKTEEDIPQDLPCMFSITVLTKEVYYPYQEGDALPHWSNMEFVSDFSWFINAPSVLLNGENVRMALRPIQASDDIYVVYSFAREDGTSFSLWPIPYSEAVQ